MIDTDFSDLAAHRQIDRSEILALADWRRRGLKTSLLTIIAIDGKSPRSVGAQMAVNALGQIQGYLTGGCLEHELALVALALAKSGRNEVRRYGRGSPYIDMRLPCGSGIDVYYDQALADAEVFEAENLVKTRQPFTLLMNLATGTSSIRPLDPALAHHAQQEVRGDWFERLYKPVLRLRIFGAGFASVQLAFLAQSAGLRVELYTNEDITVSAAAALGIVAQHIRPSDHLVDRGDDWTASVLMFHEHDRETFILAQILEQPGFYIGAIGNRLVNQQRIDVLRAMNASDAAIARITMPAGLVRQARNATEIAVGVLAEVLDVARRSGLVV